MQETRDFGFCELCKEKVERKYLPLGSDQSTYCKDCYKRRFCSASGDQKFRVRTKQYCDRVSNKKLIPYPELYYHKPAHTSCMSKKSVSSMMSLSKRPLQCPKADCNKFISIFTLESHFKYEHKEVPIILTQLDSRSALEFYPRDIRYNITQCIVLLNVINHDFSTIIPQSTNYSSKTNIQVIDSRPVVVLLATRIPCHELAKHEAEESYDESLEDADSSRTYKEQSVILVPDDQIIIWMASNVQTNLSYTVAASTLSNKIRQKYFGPMLTLGENPAELCSNGSGLILTHYHVNGMSENGAKPLALDAVIHSPD